MKQCGAKYKYDPGTTYSCFRDDGHEGEHADFVGSWNRSPEVRERLDVEALTKLAIETAKDKELPPIATWETAKEAQA